MYVCTGLKPSAKRIKPFGLKRRRYVCTGLKPSAIESRTERQEAARGRKRLNKAPQAARGRKRLNKALRAARGRKRLNKALQAEEAAA